MPVRFAKNQMLRKLSRQIVIPNRTQANNETDQDWASTTTEILVVTKTSVVLLQGESFSTESEDEIIETWLTDCEKEKG